MKPIAFEGRENGDGTVSFYMIYQNKSGEKVEQFYYRTSSVINRGTK